MSKNKLYDVESAIFYMNKLRDKEYAIATCRSITEHSLYVWPATGNHTVWHDIALFAFSVDEYAHPHYLEVNGENRVVYEINVL